MTLPPDDEEAARREVIDRQTRLVRDALAQALSGVRRVALVDWPEYANVGDSAIWLGSLRAIEATQARLVYVASQTSYNAGALGRALGPDGAVLLQGGGNLGDLWPAHERHRHRILEDFPDRPVIQLSQSIHFDDLALAEATGRRLRAHPHYLLMVRDRPSEAFAREHLGCQVRLVPDMAFGLGPLHRRGRPHASVSWMSRRDKEAPGPPPSGAETIRAWDWTSMRTPRLLDRMKSLGESGARLTRPAWLTRSVRRVAYESIARRRLDWGLGLLSAGEAVVTNRLHGHILSLLAGIPQFVSDSRQGKVRAYYDAWTHGAPGVTWCGSESEALRRAMSRSKNSTGEG